MSGFPLQITQGGSPSVSYTATSKSPSLIRSNSEEAPQSMGVWEIRCCELKSL